MNKRTFTIILISILAACTPKVQEINYGEDQCDSCRMTIVDKRFGAELVTKKGKVTKYDAIECMARAFNENPDKVFIYSMVTDFHNPDSLIDATNARFLINADRPSPMGGNLSAYLNMESIEKELQETGTTFLWEELLKEYSQ